MKCPTCKGTGKQTIQVSEGRGPFKDFQIRCSTCGGKGEVSEAVIQALKREQAMWCQCGNPSGEAEFYDDRVDPACRKHHWNCKDCGKVLQVG